MAVVDRNVKGPLVFAKCTDYGDITIHRQQLELADLSVQVVHTLNIKKKNHSICRRQIMTYQSQNKALPVVAFHGCHFQSCHYPCDPALTTV